MYGMCLSAKILCFPEKVNTVTKVVKSSTC